MKEHKYVVADLVRILMEVVVELDGARERDGVKRRKQSRGRSERARRSRRPPAANRAHNHYIP